MQKDGLIPVERYIRVGKWKAESAGNAKLWLPSSLWLMLLLVLKAWEDWFG